MKGMLIKDFSLLKGQKQFLITVCVFAIAFSFIKDLYYFGISYLIIMFVFFTLSTIAYDEYDNGNPFLFTLPISRRSYVREKYVFCFLTALGGCTLNLVLFAVMQIVKKDREADIQTFLLTMAAALAVGMVMMAFVLPLQFKFGSEKRQMAMIAAFVIIFLIFFCGQKLVDSLGVPGFVIKLDSMSIESIAALLSVIVIALVCVSYLISVRIMEKKEF